VENLLICRNCHSIFGKLRYWQWNICRGNTCITCRINQCSQNPVWINVLKKTCFVSSSKHLLLSVSLPLCASNLSTSPQSFTVHSKRWHIMMLVSLHRGYHYGIGYMYIEEWVLDQCIVTGQWCSHIYKQSVESCWNHHMCSTLPSASGSHSQPVRIVASWLCCMYRLIFTPLLLSMYSIR